MRILMVCPDCGLSLVPLGGEDICAEMCEECEQHDCMCDSADTEEEG